MTYYHAILFLAFGFAFGWITHWAWAKKGGAE